MNTTERVAPLSDVAASAQLRLLQRKIQRAIPSILAKTLNKNHNANRSHLFSDFQDAVRRPERQTLLR
jgi:hypothetical protein